MEHKSLWQQTVFQTGSPVCLLGLTKQQHGAQISLATNSVSNWISRMLGLTKQQHGAQISLATNSISNWITCMLGLTKQQHGAQISLATNRISNWITRMLGWFNKAATWSTNLSGNKQRLKLDHLYTWRICSEHM